MNHKRFPACVRFTTSLAALLAIGFVILSSTLEAAGQAHDPTANTCAAIIGREVTWETLPDGTNKYTITLTLSNLTHLSGNPYGFAHATVLPPAGFSPAFLAPSPDPIPPGGIGTVTLCYYGFPGKVCFNLALHNPDLTECCSPEEICLDLPSGFDFVIDEIRVERSPSPRVALRFPTQLGFRYQIEQAPTVLGSWQAAACTSPDAIIDAQGFLLGTGGDVTCHIGMAPGEGRQFYRGVEYP